MNRECVNLFNLIFQKNGEKLIGLYNYSERIGQHAVHVSEVPL
jgi:hypothetical protein